MVVDGGERGAERRRRRLRVGKKDASGEDLSSLVGCGWWGCDDP